MSDEVGFGLRLELLRHTYSVRPGDDDVPALGLLTVAEGLAEVIALLRPLVDTVTAQPEPLKVVDPCGENHTYGLMGDGGITSCARRAGHTGKHANAAALFGSADGMSWEPGT